VCIINLIETNITQKTLIIVKIKVHNMLLCYVNNTIPHNIIDDLLKSYKICIHVYYSNILLFFIVDEIRNFFYTDFCYK